MHQGDLLDFIELRRHGGRRPGAGRKRGKRRRVAHRSRAPFRDGVLHVTARVCKGVASLRTRRAVRELEASLRAGCERGEFRVVEYSIQRDHFHYIVEARDAGALGRGMHALHVRLARAVNRVQERCGPVFEDRFHVHLLRAPAEVRNAIQYVLSNARKHGVRWRRGALLVDPASSGRWFAHWTLATPRAHDPPAVSRARSWLLTTGWRRRGGLDPRSTPGGTQEGAITRPRLRATLAPQA